MDERTKSLIEHGRAQHLLNLDARVVSLNEAVKALNATVQNLVQRINTLETRRL